MVPAFFKRCNTIRALFKPLNKIKKPSGPFAGGFFIGIGACGKHNLFFP